MPPEDKLPKKKVARIPPNPQNPAMLEIGADLPLTLAAIRPWPMPPPGLRGVTGCAQEGCSDGALLPLQGVRFDALSPANNVVRFAPPPGSRWREAFGRPPSACVLLNVTGTNLTCWLRAPPSTAGTWSVLVDVVGAQPASIDLPLRTEYDVHTSEEQCLAATSRPSTHGLG